MATHKGAYYRYLFIIGAIWNVVIALGFLFLTKQVLPLFGLQMPADPAWFYLFSALVLVFGLGYYWVSRNLDKNHAVVGMGVIGKLLVFLILGYYWMAGSIPTLTALAGVGDLVFAVLFLAFLINYKADRTESFDRSAFPMVSVAETYSGKTIENGPRWR